MIATCHFCPTVETRMINGNHWDGEKYVRVDVCGPCYDVGKLANRPRKPRQARSAPQYAATDWNMLVAFTNGGSKRARNS